MIERLGFGEGNVMSRTSDVTLPDAWVSRAARFAGVAFVTIALSAGAQADTLSEALVQAYLGNPQLRAQRADTRATDENLPNALSGYRPTVTAAADGGLLNEVYMQPGQTTHFLSHPAGASVQITQNLFNGFRTENQVLLAQSQIMSSQESLRYTELSVFASAVGAYMDVLRDSAIVGLRASNVQALEQQRDDTCMQLKDGEKTRTDLSQAEAALSQGNLDLVTAETNLKVSLSVYRQIIGLEPKSLAAVKMLLVLLPHTLDEAFLIADAEHPLILAARHNVEEAEETIKIAEGSLLPTLNAVASASHNYNYGSVEGQRYNNYAVEAQLNIPVYDGGVSFSQIRQAKEKLGEALALSDQQRDQVRASVAQSFAAWKNSHRAIAAARAEVKQNEAALAGVREEARHGQRTTFDILYEQQSLLNARIVLITSEHDQVVVSFSLLAAIGRLSAQTLGLDVPLYDAKAHFNQVKNKWIGTDP